MKSAPREELRGGFVYNAGNVLMNIAGERMAQNRTELDRPEDFEAIFARYSEAIYNYVLRIMGNPNDAADFTQETFLKAYMALSKSEKEYNLRPWLYRIATNVCLDELRRRGIIKWQPWEVLTDRLGLHPVEKETPERIYAYKEDVELVQRTLGRLLPQYRMVLLLREYQELSYEEIAETLNRSVAAVKSLLFRAREEFRRAYVIVESEPGERRS